MIVENPKGVSSKYEVDEEFGVIGLDRVFPVPMSFPFEYGFIPGTWNEADDDPVDAMVLKDDSTFVGCLLYIHIIGMYRMTDGGQEDFKILGVCDGDKSYSKIHEYEDLPKKDLNRIEFFWQNYKRLNPRTEIKGLGWSSASVAESYVKKSVEFYEEKFKK